MKHLPNIITLGNLFFGCVAIAFILNSQPFLSEVNGQEYWVSGTEQAYWGSIFIFCAALLDWLDGLVANWLGVHSPIGKELDSLADVVSFGVAPSMILMKMLWSAWMRQPNAMDITMFAVSPAFLIACFAALRLAKFNIHTGKTNYFTGVPVPAVALFVASFPFVNLYNPFGIGFIFQKVWLLLLIIAILCWLMVCRFKFFTLKLKGFSVKTHLVQLLWLGLSLGSIFFLQWLSIPFAFLLYLTLSLGTWQKAE